ncbi:flagellar basal-body rod modification protein FlgD [Clostridium amylolyticum]|uniref:Basal-body rod modification protein FlgD n=1 Tax=Clostridium amylolyticum TaxID=1121298 RepID=A0A1M6CFT6_9CLOT|nr:flagellar hook capping FlgD N-terminal domain-containing protein [Clostridium amylolyticum]SHI59701.1 flagellar basal-body rod modification protein FlgD [Clostridium amylolyticum]
MKGFKVDESYGNRATERGTQIISPGSDMDKNAFLRILAAELSNQDPMNSKDSTQYVTQMAQFASMEQMTNLNSTMSGFAVNSLVGKGVTLKVLDPNGVPYTGVVKAVTRQGSNVFLSVEINEAGSNKIMDFKQQDIQTVLDVPNFSLDSVSGNMALLTAASLIGKETEFEVPKANGEGKEDKVDKFSGIVQGVFKEKGFIKLNVKLKDSDEIKTFTLGQLVKVSDVVNKD